MKKLTIKDVAKHAGVSIATVSRVINKQGASKKASEKVLQAIEELGYYPNALARGLVSRRSNTIGIMIPDVSNPFFAELFRGMEDNLHSRNSNTFICNTETNEDRILKYFDFLYEKQVDGIIFTSELFTEQFYSKLKQAQVPIVLVSTESRQHRLPAIKINDYYAARDGVQHLITAGHKNIAMVSGPEQDPIAGLPRFQGYQAALAENGLVLKYENVFFGDFSFESGKAAFHHLMNMDPRPTAVFCASDVMASGVINEALRSGLNLPEDLSVLGFDNVKLAQMTFPALSTVAQPLYEMGGQAIDLLFQLIEANETGESQEDLYKTHYVDHQVIERESVFGLS